ncbi:desmocollin-2-like [Rhinophrynus dorsalis]
MGPTMTLRGSITLSWCLLMLLLSLTVSGETCQKVKLKVPSEIYSGALIGKVNLKPCLNSHNFLVRSNNPDFLVLDNGLIYAERHISLPNGKTSFAIILLDLATLDEKKIHVKLVSKAKTGKSRYARELLRRTKRRWSPLPFSIHEYDIGPFPKYVQTVQSDTQENYTLRYSISGSGVDQPPVNLFFIEPETGRIFVTKQVDREEYASFKLTAYAKTLDGYSPEFPLPVVVKVEDANDNAPVFTEESFCVEVYEHTKAGVIIGRVNATDRDEPNSLHSTLRYSIISQFPSSPVMFAINAENGIITTTSDRLDREVADTYVLILEVRDMPGKPSYLCSTGTVSITVLDINDHAPVFSAQSYQTEVNENESGMVILRIPITDDDLINTPNWRAKYTITQGNEKGYFNITTDPNTNEGLLSVVKGLNYEETPRIQIQVGVANEESLITQTGMKSSGMSTVPVTIIVKDVDEGPEFQPLIKVIRVKENQTIGTVIGEYQAIDPETKSNTGIRYTKLSDVYNWITISETTGQIITAKVLDYESNEAPNHQYNVTVLATDQSGKSGTGTIVINVEDINDNAPLITSSESTICQMGRTFSILSAEDPDGIPNSAPFKFSLDTSGNPSLANQFKISPIDGKSARLEDIGNLALGTYDVPITVLDQQGHGRTQIVRVTKCNCPNSNDCAARSIDSRAALGGWAILVMVLSAVLFFLLLAALLACLCGAGAGGGKGKLGFPDDSAQQNLIVTNSEAPGADVMDPNFKIPVHVANPNVSGNAPSTSGAFGQGGQISQTGGMQQFTTSTRKIGQLTSDNTRGGLTLDSMRGGHQLLDTNRHTYAEWHSFMNSHLGDKLYMCGQDEEQQHGEDYVLAYNYEGKGSLAGSVGCCSDFKGEEDRMDFLNHLEPKFRTLAEVCAKK